MSRKVKASLHSLPSKLLPSSQLFPLLALYYFSSSSHNDVDPEPARRRKLEREGGGSGGDRRKKKKERGESGCGGGQARGPTTVFPPLLWPRRHSHFKINKGAFSPLTPPSHFFPPRLGSSSPYVTLELHIWRRRGMKLCRCRETSVSLWQIRPPPGGDGISREVFEWQNYRKSVPNAFL